MVNESQSAPGYIREQIGKIVGTLEGIQANIRERHDDNKKEFDRISSEIRNVKHEQRQEWQKISGNVDILQLHVKAIETKTAAIETKTDNTTTEIVKLRGELQEVRGPVDQLIGLKNRILAMGALAAGLISVLWVLAAPVYDFLVHHLLGAK